MERIPIQWNPRFPELLDKERMYIYLHKKYKMFSPFTHDSTALTTYILNLFVLKIKSQSDLIYTFISSALSIFKEIYLSFELTYYNNTCMSEFPYPKVAMTQ